VKTACAQLKYSDGSFIHNDVRSVLNNLE